MAETLNDIGFLFTKADPYVWYWSVVKHNVFEYYEYILCYVDDILCISHDPVIALGHIQAVLRFKRDKMEQPKIYLRDQDRNMIVDGAEGWYISVENYVRATVENVEQNLSKSNQHLPNSCKTVIMSVHQPKT